MAEESQGYLGWIMSGGVVGSAIRALTGTSTQSDVNPVSPNAKVIPQSVRDGLSGRQPVPVSEQSQSAFSAAVNVVAPGAVGMIPPAVADALTSNVPVPTADQVQANLKTVANLIAPGGTAVLGAIPQAVTDALTSNVPVPTAEQVQASAVLATGVAAPAAVTAINNIPPEVRQAVMPNGLAVNGVADALETKTIPVMGIVAPGAVAALTAINNYINPEANVAAVSPNAKIIPKAMQDALSKGLETPAANANQTKGTLGYDDVSVQQTPAGAIPATVNVNQK